MKFIILYLVFLTLAIIYIIKKKSNYEYFYDDTTKDLTESIKHLGVIAKELAQDSEYKLPGSLEIPNNLKSNNLSVNTYFNLLPPKSIICFWSNDIPEGWGLCNGKYYLKMDYRYNDNGEEINTTLEKVLDDPTENIDKYIQTPDLRNHFILAKDEATDFMYGGSDRIMTNHIPEHTHNHKQAVSVNKVAEKHKWVQSAGSTHSTTAPTGTLEYKILPVTTNSTTHTEFKPSYYTLNYIMKL